VANVKHELPRASVEIVPKAPPQQAYPVGSDVGSHGLGWTNPLQEYWLDACQRWILTLDVLRQRGNSYLEQRERISPEVLNFPFEVVLDGRTFERPVNYVLVRIEPPPGLRAIRANVRLLSSIPVPVRARG
jgi:hypothetical protein